MGISIASDVERIECTVSVGQGIQCSASQNGSITIHTSTDSITILLQRIVNKKRIPFKTVSEHHFPAVLSSPGNSTSQASFWFAGNSELEDTRQDEGNDEPEDLPSSDDEEAPELAGEDDRADDINATNSDGSNNRRSVQKKQETPISDEELTEICRKLASRTLKKWNSKQRQEKKSLEAVLSDWPTFFGYTSYATLEQWSYRALDTSEKFGTLQRPFHKVSLANWWNECLERRTPKNITSRVKARMLSALEPGFEKLESKEKDAKRKQIDRYVVQGEVISLMLAQTPGLVITVSNLITTAEYYTLWKNRHRSPVSRLDWISMELNQDSKLYSETVKCIFSLMCTHFVPVQRPTPNQQAGCAPSRSSIEPASGTNGASSLHTVAPSSQQLVPSYQVSLSDQQPFDHVVEARSNTAKRRKISRYAASQVRERPCTIQEDNQNISAPISKVSPANNQGEHQALDFTTAANVVQSLQQGSQVYTRDAAGIMPQLEHRSQPTPTASVAILGRHSASEHSPARRRASDAAGSNNKGTIDTNTTANYDALSGLSTTTTVDGLMDGITDDHVIENPTGNSMQPIDGHSCSRPSLLDGAFESRLPSPTPTHTLMPNHIELESGTGIAPTPTISDRIGEESSKDFESSAPIRLSDYIGPEISEDIREWETVWAPEET